MQGGVRPIAPKRRRTEDEDLIVTDEVSDGESSGDECNNLDDVDELLSINGSEDAENEMEIVLANRHGALNVDAILDRDYGGASPRKTLPGVSHKLAEVVTNWMRVPPKREAIRDMFKEALLPENVDGLLPVKINEVLYHRLPFRAKINDQRLRGINTYFARGVGPLLPAMDTLIKAECALEDGKVGIHEGALMIGQVKIDIKQLRLWLGNALKILAVGHSVVLCKRRTILKPYLDPKYHNLLKLSNPVTTELLGGDLEQKIADGARVSEAGRRLAIQPQAWPQKKKGFSPRGGRQQWQRGQPARWPAPRLGHEHRGRG